MSSLGLAHNVLRALAGSHLTVQERAAVCVGVIRSLESSQLGDSLPLDGDLDLLAGVEALPDAGDVQRRVEASWLVLQERLGSNGAGVDDAAVAHEVSATNTLRPCCMYSMGD